MTTGGLPTIDIVIPVHTVERPIERAVRSVVAARAAGVRAIVICHNVAATEISSRLGGLAQDRNVRLFALHDGVRSPAGPLNEGVRRAEAEYVGFLGSDDELVPSALQSWQRELNDRPTVLVGQLVTEDGGRIMTPAPRPGRFDDLDPVADLLNLRAAPVGVLMRRELLLGPDCPGFRAGFRTGEDIALGLFLWNCAGSLRYSRCTDGYFGHESGSDRVTGQAFAPEEVVAPIIDALGLPVLRALPRRRRQAIGVKLLRNHVFNWVRAVHANGAVDEELRRAVAAAIACIMDFAPGVLGYFPLSQVQVFRALCEADLDRIRTALDRAEHTNYRLKLVPWNPLRTFAPEGFMMLSRRLRMSAESFPAPKIPATAGED